MSTERPRTGRRVDLLGAALVAVFALVLASLTFAAPAAHSQDDAPGAASDESELAVIMDASSSMLIDDVGMTRLDAAKEAGRALVDSLPDTARVGMLAYGSVEHDAPENHAVGCQDIRTLAPVGPLDRERLLAEIDGLDARGYTPIGASLRAAADEFTGDGERTIVLVSDGEDTCAPPAPCEVAAELADEGIGTTIHTVGFRVDEVARGELECIADVAGGEYHETNDVGELAESMDFLTRRGLERYEVSGTPFEFGMTPDEAQYLGEGTYVTTVAESTASTVSEDAPHFFRVAVPDGYRAQVGATPIIERDPTHPDRSRTVNLNIEASNAVSNCHEGQTSDRVSGVSGTGAASSGVVSRFGQDDRERCDPEGWLVEIRPMVGRGQTFEGPAPRVDIEVSVQYEPELSEDEVEALPEPDSDDSAATPVEATDAQPIAGGVNFSEATDIGPGTYSGEIIPGEVHYYRVGVDWGQRPVATLRSDALEATERDRFNVELLNPMRRLVDDERSSGGDRVTENTVATDRPVRYRNREDGGRNQSLAGEYFVAVSLSAHERSDMYGVNRPYELALDLEGESESGPDWRPVTEPGPEPSAEPILYTPDEDDGTDDEAPAEDDGAAETSDDEIETGISPTQWVVIGVGGLLGLGVIGAALVLALRKGD